VSTVKRPDTEITPADFEKQMTALKDTGITVIPMQDFLAWRRGEKNIPAKSAVITLDDGWKSQYEVAWPILKKFGYPFTLFIYPGFVKGGHYSGGESLTWEQLGEMRDAGVDIEGHSYSHQNLKLKPKATTPKNAQFAQFKTYEEWLKYELVESKKVIEEKLGVKVNVLAVPYGLSNQQVRDMTMKSGYEALFTVNPVVNNFATPMDALGRYAIEANKPQTFAQAISFPGSASTGLAATAMPTGAGQGNEPADGATVTSPPSAIKADISGFGLVDPGSIAMRVSGFGIVPTKYDDQTHLVTSQFTQKLHDGEYTVIVSAKAGARKLETRWTFTVNTGGKPAAKPGT
jgi:peptidoglycan/xylan/chitin deacetylase (PgdA/CDA1 family)